jgi:uncharacterized membrane protein
LQQYSDRHGVLQVDWRQGRPWVAMCYSDIVPLYGIQQLDKKGTFPYRTSWVEAKGTPQQRTRYLEYPVLIGLFQGAVAKLANGWAVFAKAGWLPGGLPVVLYFDFAALALAGGWLTTVWALTLLARRRPWDVAIAAISPLVVVHAFTNFDMIAIAFATTGLLAWARRRPVLSGVLLGLGGAAKLYPLLLVGPILVLCVRAGRRGDGLRVVAAAGGAFALVNAPIALLYPAGWWEFFRLNTYRKAEMDSLYHVISHFTGWQGFDGSVGDGHVPTVLNTVSALLFLACCAAIVWVGLSAPHRPRLAQLCLLVVAAFLLTNKVWSPQYSLWLVPLAILALPRWRLLLAWMAVDALVWAPLMYFFLGADKKGLPEDWFLGTVLVRDALVVTLCVFVLREIYHPQRDVVRAGGEDDPCGGVLAGTADHLSLGCRRRPATEVISAAPSEPAETSGPRPT